MVALVGSWPHIGPCRNRSGRTAHYRTFRTITAGRDDLEVMVKPSGGGGLLPGGVTTIFVLHQQPTIVLHGPSITYEGEGIEGRRAERCIAYAKVNSTTTRPGQRCPGREDCGTGYWVVTQTCSMTTGVTGLSMGPVFTFWRLSSTSMPSTSWPITVYWPSSWGVGWKQM